MTLNRIAKGHLRIALLATTCLFSLPASAQEAQSGDDTTQAETGSEGAIVVTGSRIRRLNTDTAAPVTAVNAEVLTDRGFVQAGEALNQMTSIVPFRPTANGGSASSGDGRQYPNLYGLGAGRTLTLLNGRRMVSSSSNLGDAVVDTNVIPVGLLERVDIVQAGGAAVYGSDAVSGVVNYVLKKNYEGVELDLQKGISSRGDLGSTNVRLTAGRNFAGGRGNIAIELGYSDTPPLLNSARPAAYLGRSTVPNTADRGPTDGIPSIREIVPANFWSFSPAGILFSGTGASAANLARVNGSALQLNNAGGISPYNPGTIVNTPFAEGGDGWRLSNLGSLYTGVERFTANVLGHYELSDSVTLSTELLYAKVRATDLDRGILRNVLNPASTNQGLIPFTINNPYLTDSAKASLAAAYPAFAAGGNLYASKIFMDLVPSNSKIYTNDVYRGLLSLNGDFDALGRNFYWSASASYARTESRLRGWGADNAKLNKSLNAVRNGSGNIVCAVNADAITTNDDPSCAPLNFLGVGNISSAARDYVSTVIGNDTVNEQQDYLLTLGGALAKLPAGDLAFSVGYEHRRESASFDPLPASRDGLTGLGAKQVSASGKYNTNEFSGEVLIPVLGEGFNLPMANRLEISAAYRYVSNSIAGKEQVWNVGGQFEPVKGVTFRATRSRNFRAPNLNQLFAPESVALGTIVQDPCDIRRISAGPNPTARRANCQALFAANPNYGPLASFVDDAESFAVTTITTRGNRNLRNEVSKTLTYGVVVEPSFLPGLQITADRVEIDLTDGISQFTTQNFLATCFDSTPQPGDICNNFFTRLAAPANGLAAGTVITGTTTTFNAGSVNYRGETYQVRYGFNIGRVFGGERDLGSLLITANATHNSRLVTSVTGFDRTILNGTVVEPSWLLQGNVVYRKGPVRVSYNVFHMSSALQTADATIENNPNPRVAANTTHDISVMYDAGSFAVRAGVTNFTDKMPSYPSLVYGDILGRRFFAGFTARF